MNGQIIYLFTYLPFVWRLRSTTATTNRLPVWRPATT